jgi:hypothetical protein
VTPLRLLSLSSVTVLSALLVACGGGDPPEGGTATHAKKGKPAAPRLATTPKRPGEIIVKGRGTGVRGPFRFRPAPYVVRFVQYAPEAPSINFRTESSSFVAQLGRRPGEITATNVPLFNDTSARGKSIVSSAGGRYYVDVSSADHSYVIRLTPRR